MRHLFLPDCYIEHFSKLNLDMLHNHGIRVLICDVDNTLAAHDVVMMDQEVQQFVQRVQDAGIIVAIVSNNSKARVSQFVGTNDFYFISNAKKPLHFAFRAIQRRFQVQVKEMAMLGDQLLTDMLGANTYGMRSILTKPLVERDIAWTRINRIIEQVVYGYLKKRYRFEKGVYYDK